MVEKKNYTFNREIDLWYRTDEYNLIKFKPRRWQWVLLPIYDKTLLNLETCKRNNKRHLTENNNNNNNKG